MRTWRGYRDMGRLGWARPSCHVFQDRSTGTLYMLSHDSTGPSLVLDTPVPRRCNARPEEPVVNLSIGRRRLFVENGTLGWETVDDRPIPSIYPDLYTVNFAEQKVTFRVDVVLEEEAFAEGEAILLVEGGDELLLTEGGDALLLTEGEEGTTEELDLTRLDLGQLP